MLQTGLLPPPMMIQLTLEMTKMMLHPVRHSRGVIDLINGYQEMLTKFMQLDPMGRQHASAAAATRSPAARSAPQWPTTSEQAQPPQPGQGLPPGGPPHPGPGPQIVNRPN